MRATESLAVRPATRLAQPVVIGHRGAPAYRPEHTAASYELAIDLGAELIEPDVVVSRDGVLVVRHENELSLSTDVAARPEFADRRTTKQVDDQVVHRLVRRGLHARRAAHAARRRADARAAAAEHRLRRPLRHPHARRGHRRWPARRSTADRPDPRAGRAQARRLVPTEHGLPMAELVTEELRRLDADRRARAGHAAVLRRRGAARRCAPGSASDGPQMVQLVDDNADGRRDGHPRRAARDLHLRAGRSAPAATASSARTGSPAAGTSALVDEAHRAALSVFCWTLRAENAFLPAAPAASATLPRRSATRSPRPASCWPSASTA